MSRRYVCFNGKCSPLPKGFFFRVEAGQATGCPKCGIRQDDPRLGRLILEAREIHYEPPSAAEGFGVGYAACSAGPGAKVLGVIQGEPSIVTCEKCRATKAWQDASAGTTPTVAAGHDFPVTATNGPDGPVYQKA